MSYKVFNKILYSVIFLFLVFSFVSCSGSENDDTIEQVGLFDFTGDVNYKSNDHTEISAAKNQYTSVNGNSLEKDWYKKSSFYHIWVKSFADFDGDGCGDFKGIESKLDYIKNVVGCDAIWLSPIFACNYISKDVNANMHGYDTINYYSINEYFGTSEDLTSLINSAHQKGMKIIFDFVPNHTSDAHPWFLSSKEKDSEKRNWYLWNDEKLSWNNGMSSDTWHKNGSEYYYGAFNGMMPDLNFRNYEVREEMKNVVRYWLNKGFDGLRVDAVRYLVEEENACCDTNSTHEWFQELRAEVVDAYSSPKFMVCEAWIEGNRNSLNEYFGTSSNPEFNMVFDFDVGRASLLSIVNGYDKTENTLSPNKPTTNSTFGTFLGNHDEYYGRVGTVLGGQEQLIKQATALSLLRPTVPFIYYGNEIGQPEENLSGDIRLRGPFKWNLAESQKDNPHSILNLNKTILSLKDKYDELQTGVVTKLNSTNNTCLAYFIGQDYSSNKFLCVFNFNNRSVSNVSFLQNNLQRGTSAKVIIGDNQENTIEFTDDSVIVKKLAPYSYRLYYIGNDNTISNLFDDETYTQNAEYVPSPSNVYIRGTMNAWGLTDLMNKTVVDGDIIFTKDISGSSSVNGKFEFKFDTGSWAEGQNWGLKSLNVDELSGYVISNGNNITVSGINSSKTYTFTFNFTDLTFSVKEKSN